jgi:hypothetical protein
VATPGSGAARVIAGHFGFAAIVKAREPQVPLWSLMLATVWLDVVFVPLYLAGIETIVPVAGARGTYGTGVIYADYTHSLLGALLLSGVFALAFANRWGRRTLFVLGFVSFSHWLLDILVHRADMPFLPHNLGNLPRLGFGLWSHPEWVMAMELALVVAGALLYWREARRATMRAGKGIRLATLTGGLIGIGGITVLALDVTGALG